MNEHEKINYVEFPAKDITQTKAFFSSLFGWEFEDFGEEYTAFSNQGLDGGFFNQIKTHLPKTGVRLLCSLVKIWKTLYLRLNLRAAT